MPLLKRTYELPHETVLRFEQTVTPGLRDTVLAEAIGDWLTHRQREQAIIEGCREMADVYLDLEQAYHPLEEEVARGFDATS